MEEGAFLIILEFYCQVEDFIKHFRAQIAVKQIAVSTKSVLITSHN